MTDPTAIGSAGPEVATDATGETTPFNDALIPAPGGTGNQLVLDYRPGAAPAWQPGDWASHNGDTWLVDHRETTGDGSTRIRLATLGEGR